MDAQTNSSSQSDFQTGVLNPKNPFLLSGQVLGKHSSFYLSARSPITITDDAFWKCPEERRREIAQSYLVATNNPCQVHPQYLGTHPKNRSFKYTSRFVKNPNGSKVYRSIVANGWKSIGEKNVVGVCCMHKCPTFHEEFWCGGTATDPCEEYGTSIQLVSAGTRMKAVRCVIRKYGRQKVSHVLEHGIPVLILNNNTPDFVIDWFLQDGNVENSSELQGVAMTVVDFICDLTTQIKIASHRSGTPLPMLQTFVRECSFFNPNVLSNEFKKLRSRINDDLQYVKALIGLNTDVLQGCSMTKNQGKDTHQGGLAPAAAFIIMIICFVNTNLKCANAELISRGINFPSALHLLGQWSSCILSDLELLNFNVPVLYGLIQPFSRDDESLRTLLASLTARFVLYDQLVIHAY